jgi:penicillin-binding protein 1A
LVGKFLEMVYNDNTLGYQRGPFPKPTITITKEYKGCAPAYPARGVPRDSTDGYFEGDSVEFIKPTSPVLEETQMPVDTTNSR